MHDAALDAEVIAFLRGRSAPCPRCGYELADIQKAVCPECGEHLRLTVGAARVRFGWFVVAMAPGCFSGVAACFVLIPIVMSTGQALLTGKALTRQQLPWPIVAADVFGFASAASVALLYRHRHRFLAWPSRRQGMFAAGVWGGHVFALAALITAMVLLY